MNSYEKYKTQLVGAAQDLAKKGYLMATGGNLSIRIDGQQSFAITPSNRDYAKMTSGDICVLDFSMNQFEGTLKPSVEAAMHGAVYQSRPDVNAVIHTHQACASALTLINAPIPALFDEQARFLGRSVEIIPYAPSGTGLLKNAVAKHVRNRNNAFMMQNHGVLVLGYNMERAVHNVEILEKCALAYLLALCSERRATKIPLAVREIAFARLRREQKKVEHGGQINSGE